MCYCNEMKFCIGDKEFSINEFYESVDKIMLSDILKDLYEDTRRIMVIDALKRYYGYDDDEEDDVVDAIIEKLTVKDFLDKIEEEEKKKEPDRREGWALWCRERTFFHFILDFTGFADGWK